MPRHSRPKDGVASLAYGRGIQSLPKIDKVDVALPQGPQRLDRPLSLAMTIGCMAMTAGCF
jgi:hypothetical protein